MMIALWKIMPALACGNTIIIKPADETPLTAQVAALKIGADMDPDVQINALVSRKQQDSALRYLDIARREGAQFTTGGEPDLPGYFVRPTVLGNLQQHMTAVQEELFGPVPAVLPFDVEQAPGMVNDSCYGLTASLWSNDLGRVVELIPRIETGTVWVNNHVPSTPTCPSVAISSRVWAGNSAARPSKASPQPNRCASPTEAGAIGQGHPAVASTGALAACPRRAPAVPVDAATTGQQAN
ncbi:Aldehyde dehydrogenase family protein [Pseudomonas flavescens]|uniref:Aldehyde dehydrogenase family protein n=1 Tax=Phytopseudomonas flavescens TaxID=29435 RepID=A0A1G8FRG2_9GAMM|nr:Aldehyde dehydrogenase family protein [Pseudomonas flavescens]